MDNNEIVKKSIFRQKTYVRRYSLEYSQYNYMFSTRSRKELNIDSSSNLVSDEEIFVCNLEMPLLEDGEEFFIDELNTSVVIESRCRSSLGSVIYYVRSKHVDDEETKRTFDELHKYKELYDKYNKLENMYNKAVSLIPFWNKKKLTK